jgi:hypothetical protein
LIAGLETLRLHDNMIWFLRDQIGPKRCRAVHEAMVNAIDVSCGKSQSSSRWGRRGFFLRAIHPPISVPNLDTEIAVCGEQPVCTGLRLAVGLALDQMKICHATDGIQEAEAKA